MGIVSPANIATHFNRGHAKKMRYDERKNFQKLLKFTIVLFQRELISMQSNFNSPQKPNQMSERKCLAVFLKDNK